MQKKAQIQMMESMGVLFVFIIIIMFGYIFYAVVSQSSQKQAVDEQREMEAVELAQRVAYLPELQCAREGIELEPCVDLYKIRSFRKIMCDTATDPSGCSPRSENVNKYLQLFGYSEIYLDIVFPENKKTNFESNCYPIGVDGPFNAAIPATLIDCNTAEIDVPTELKAPPYKPFIIYKNIPDKKLISKKQIPLPTAIYDPDNKQFYYGLIVVNYYSQS